MTFDVIVIGSGQAGVPLASRLAGVGKRVLLAERADLGGTCVNTGCTPTKTMIASARAAHVARTAGRLGVRAGQVDVDLAAVVDRKDAIVRRWREGVSKRLEVDGLTVVRAQARFVGERQVEVGGEVHGAEIVVINVGARPLVPPIDGLAQVPWLGVTIVDPVEHLMSREDPEISSALEDVFRTEEIALELGTRTTRVEGRAGEITLTLGNGKKLRGSHLLVAVGRRPNTDDLGCEKAGIALDQKGFVVADDQYRTSAKGVYAVGDVLGGPQFTHTSWDDHRLLFDILLGRSRRSRSGRFIPYTVFTDPQVSGVGLTEKEARERGVPFESASMPFGDIARAVEVDETAGQMKVLVDPKTERVVGAALVGAEAGELVHVFVALMQAGASARAIVDAEFVHPTFAEGVQSLVMKLDRFSLR